MGYDFGPISNASAWLVTAGVFGALATDVSRNVFRLATGRTVVLLSVFVWFLLEALVVPDTVEVFTQRHYDQGVMLVGLATAAFLLTYHSSRSRIFDDLRDRLRRVESPHTIWTLFLIGTTIGLLAMAVFVNFRLSAFAEGLTGLQQRWTDPFQRGRYGGLRDAILELAMFMRAVVPLGAIILLSRRFTTGRRFIAAIVIGWLLLRAINSGHRSQVLPLVLPVAAAVYWKASPWMQRRLLIVGLPLAIVGGFLFSAVVVASRNQGEVVDTISATDYVGFEMFRELLYITKYTPDSIPYQYGLTYYVQLVNPIPRFLWPGKPSADAGLLLAKAKGMVNASGEATLTNSPGFVGECWLNFGFLGVVVIPMIAGVVVRAWDDLLPYCRGSFLVFVIYAAGLATIFMSGRSFNMSTFYGVMALYGLLVLLQWMGDRRFSKDKPVPAPVRW